MRGSFGEEKYVGIVLTHREANFSPKCANLTAADLTALYDAIGSCTAGLTLFKLGFCSSNSVLLLFSS